LSAIKFVIENLERPCFPCAISPLDVGPDTDTFVALETVHTKIQLMNLLTCASGIKDMVETKIPVPLEGGVIMQ
jgi:hypothetical protein